jgi:hypothetical protein
VLPTSLTQLRLSYESNESGEDLELVECSDDPMDADDSDSASDEDAGQQYAHIKPKPWHNWVTPLVAGLAPLTGTAGAVSIDNNSTSASGGICSYHMGYITASILLACHMSLSPACLLRRGSL